MPVAQNHSFSSGQTVVLFGGSFDPPHAGHRLVAEAALKQLKADFVWWLVSPQNPLKEAKAGATETRLAATRALAAHPRFIVSDEETRLGTQYAIDTVAALKARYGNVHFIWLIGADNLAQLHHWKDWQALMQSVAIAVYPRPGATLKALAAPAAQKFAAYRLPDAAQLRRYDAPAWALLRGAQSAESSTALRQAKANRK
jgi:nicotinate-nucleotide adenylyltransferase